MSRLPILLLLAGLVLGGLSGCGDDKEKGMNRDKDRPKADRAP